MNNKKYRRHMPEFQSSSDWGIYPQRLEKRQIQSALGILIGQSFIFNFLNFWKFQSFRYEIATTV